MFYVYILFSELSGKTYTGYSQDPEQRLLSHNELSNKGWTISYRPWKIIHIEAFETKADAMKREKFLKSGKGREFVKQEILNRL
jgi:putative endonuclease